MKQMKKMIAMLMAILMLAACGTMFASCNSTRTVTVGYTIYSPMNYRDGDGNLIGFDTELAEAVFEELGYKVIFKEIKWENKYTELESGTISCIWNGFTANTADDDGVARAEKVDFSYNYMRNKQVVVIKSGTEIKGAADLGGKTGVAESGSAGESYAQSLNTDAHIKGVTKQTDALMEVKSGSAAFAVLDEQLAKTYCGKGDYADLQIVGGMSSTEEYYAIGFQKGSDLTAKVNEALIELNDKGVLEKLARKYGLENSVITNFNNQK